MFPISQFLTIYALIPKGNFQFHKLLSFLSQNLERKKLFLGNMEVLMTMENMKIEDGSKQPSKKEIRRKW